MKFSSRQKEIVDVAIRIIAKEGLDGLTTKNIASALGLSEAALYRHFRGKTDILSGVLAFFEEETWKLLDELQADESIGPFEKIYQILRRRVLQFQETPALVILIFSEEIFENTPVLSNKVYDIMQMNRNFFSRFLEESWTFRGKSARGAVLNLPPIPAEICRVFRTKVYHSCCKNHI
jgi:AcrR family transcriptional regulator